MRRVWGTAWLFVVLVVGGAPARLAADAPAAKPSKDVTAGPDGPVYDVWDSAFLEGNKVGFVHTLVTRIPGETGGLLRTSVELNLTLTRFNNSVNLRMISGDEETPDGKVTAVFMTQYLGKDSKLTSRGKVEGKTLHVTVEPNGLDKLVPWNPEAMGMYRQEMLFKDRKFKPGDRTSYLTYEPSVTGVVKVNVEAGKPELVELLGGVKRTLLRVEATPEPIQIPGNSIQLPALVYWLDRKFEPVCSRVEIPGLGTIMLYKTSKESATRPGPERAPAAPVGQSAVPGQPTPAADIGFNQLIRLPAAVPAADQARSITYEVRFTADKSGKHIENPEKAFTSDEHQTVKKTGDDVIRVKVTAQREPTPAAKPDAHGKPDARGKDAEPDEYLASCYFLKSDDPLVRRHAAVAVGKATDPWEKARKIERWVHKNITNKNYENAFLPADRVARELEGDCTEHAVLTAAMCRAVGVPSRTALGLVYVSGKDGAVMAFHMWTEVRVDGQWLGLDATLGRGWIGPDHLKIADQSWHNAQSLTPLLPLFSVIGRVQISVAEVVRDR